MDIYSLTFKELSSFVRKINYGYIDKDGDQHLDSFSNPDSSYHLQHPSELVKNNIGLCFDIVELYRSYLHKKGLYCESYFIEYSCGEIVETHAFIIHRKKNNLWYECIDNSWSDDFYAKGYYEKDLLIKSIYDWFQGYVESIYGPVNKENFYLNKYLYPKCVYQKKTNLLKYCLDREYLGSFRCEFSGMSIVFNKDKVLVLETKHNEFVFPKGHIEVGESSKEASIRECLEESGINIEKAKYLGECGEYSYTFSGGHLKVTNDNFYYTFGVSMITKTIYVHVFSIDTNQEFTLENIFVNGLWVPINEVSNTISHANTLEVYNKALEILKNNE